MLLEVYWDVAAQGASLCCCEITCSIHTYACCAECNVATTWLIMLNRGSHHMMSGTFAYNTYVVAQSIDHQQYTVDTYHTGRLANRTKHLNVPQAVKHMEDMMHQKAN